MYYLYDYKEEWFYINYIVQYVNYKLFYDSGNFSDSSHFSDSTNFSDNCLLYFIYYY